MDVLKKNLFSIICGVIAVAAIIALFWPIGGYFDALRGKAEARKSVFSALEGIDKKERHLPTVSLDNTGQGQVLNVFPTELVIGVGNKLIEQVRGQAQQMLADAIKLNEHKLLVAGALPDATPQPALNFRREYNKQFDYLSDQNRKDSFPVKIMNAGFPPTEQQVTAEKQKKTDEINQQKALGPNGQVLNQAAIDAQLADELPRVTDDLKVAAANNCKVYLDAAGIHPFQGWASLSPGAVPDAVMIYNAQMNLWVQEDVARAVADANAGAANVKEAPVKRIVRLDMPTEDFVKPVPAAAGDTPAPAANSDPSQDLTRTYTTSVTGRVTNGVYDVVPLTLRIDVDAEKINDVLLGLSRNRFFTVLNCSISNVDLSTVRAGGFFYGDKPVAALELQCELLMLRKWTEPLMPTRVKTALGIAAAPAPATP